MCEVSKSFWCDVFLPWNIFYIIYAMSILNTVGIKCGIFIYKLKKGELNKSENLISTFNIACLAIFFSNLE